MGYASPARGGPKTRLYKVTLVGKLSVNKKMEIEKTLINGWEPALYLA